MLCRLVNGRKFRIFTLAALVMSGEGCGPTRSVRELVPINKEVNDARVISLPIQRAEYKKALHRPGAADVRLLRIYHDVQSPMASRAEYRIFDVIDGGPFHLLGLRAADVIVSASGYVIPSTKGFRRYVFALENEKTASIEVRRGRERLLFQYVFIDSDGQ